MKSQEKIERNRHLVAMISAMTPEERSEMASRSPIVTVAGHCPSHFNQCMIAMQRPSASVVGGFKQWIAAGRCVAKGESGMAIWCPSTRKSKNASKPDETYFVLGTVFDISQTVELSVDHPSYRPVSAPVCDASPTEEDYYTV